MTGSARASLEILRSFGTAGHLDAARERDRLNDLASGYDAAMRSGNATGIVLNVLAVASLVACAGTVALWVRSDRPAMTASSVDSIDLTTREPLWWVVCNRGRFTVCRQVGHDWDRPRPVFKVLGLELAGSRVGGSSLYNLFVPYWMVVGATLCLPVVAGVRSMRVRRGARWRREGRCVGCGYDLTGNESGVCPECGTRR